MELEHKELGNLHQIEEALIKEMRKEAVRNGYSDLTLALEGFAYGISEIIELNGIKDNRR